MSLAQASGLISVPASTPTSSASNAVTNVWAQPSRSFNRHRGKLRLATLLIAAPLLIVGGWWLGGQSADTFARMHYKVRQLDRVQAEAVGAVEGTTDLSESFHGSGRPLPELEAEVASIRSRFDWGTAILFAFVGLVISIKLIKLTVRRHRSHREALVHQAGQTTQTLSVQP